MSGLAPARDRPVVVVRPARGLASLGLRELWGARELVWQLAVRDVQVAYQQTALGVVWAIAQPAVAAAVFTLCFAPRVAPAADGEAGYPLFAYAGLLAWTLFSATVTRAAGSVTGAGHLVTRVYFPRLALPVAAALRPLLDLAVAAVPLAPLLALGGGRAGPALLLLPAAALLVLAGALGVGLWLAALSVLYRDVRHVIPYLVQLGLFLTPVIYPARAVAARLEAWGVPGWVYGLNPAAGGVEAVRLCVLPEAAAPPGLLAASAAASALLLVTGLAYFRRVERAFADLV